MPRKRNPCRCGKMKLGIAALCRECRDHNPYTRTPEHRGAMSRVLTGRKMPPGYRPASTRPEVAAKIAAYWTPERREAKSRALSNPDGPYLGMSGRRRAALVKARGSRCKRCGSGPEARLGIHHRDRNKRNQDPDNLTVLCNRCHAQEHGGEARSRRT